MAWLVIPRKMKDWSLWALWWFLVGGGALWLLVGSVAYWVKKGWLPPDTYGWVQAIGSILALIVAVSVPLYLWKHERKERARAKFEAELGRAELLASMCGEAVVLIDVYAESTIFWDYTFTAAMHREQILDLLGRHNAAQAGELDGERIYIAKQLRFSLHDWLRFFSTEEEPSPDRIRERAQIFKEGAEALRDYAFRVVKALREKADS